METGLKTLSLTDLTIGGQQTRKGLPPDEVGALRDDELGVTGSAQKVLCRKNLETGIRCRRSDQVGGAYNLQDQPSSGVLIKSHED